MAPEAHKNKILWVRNATALPGATGNHFLSLFSSIYLQGFRNHRCVVNNSLEIEPRVSWLPQVFRSVSLELAEGCRSRRGVSDATLITIHCEAKVRGEGAFWFYGITFVGIGMGGPGRPVEYPINCTQP